MCGNPVPRVQIPDSPPVKSTETRCFGAFSCIAKPLARRVVQKKAIADDVKIKTPFAIIKVRSANCIKKQKEDIQNEPE